MHAKRNKTDEFERKTFFTLIQGIQIWRKIQKMPHFVRPYIHSRPDKNRPRRSPKPETTFGLGNLNFPLALNQEKSILFFAKPPSSLQHQCTQKPPTHPYSGNLNLARSSKNSSFRPTILPCETQDQPTAASPPPPHRTQL